MDFKNKTKSDLNSFNNWLTANKGNFAAILGVDLGNAPLFDFSVAGEHAPSNAKIPDMVEFQNNVNGLIDPQLPSIGRYLEPRLIYASPAYFSADHHASPRRCVHIAVDIFMPADTPVFAPYQGKVHSASIQNDDYDYGGLVTLEHQTPDGVKFYTLYGHLAWDEVTQLEVGQTIQTGEKFAKLGDYDQNGNWPPHVHVQLSLDDMEGKDWPGVVNPDELEKWQNIFPDPAPLLNLNSGHCTCNVAEQEGFIRQFGTLKYDAWGRTYLDAFCSAEEMVNNQISDYIRDKLNRFDGEMNATVNNEGQIFVPMKDAGKVQDLLFEHHILVGSEAGGILLQVSAEFNLNDAKEFNLNDAKHLVKKILNVIGKWAEPAR